MKPRTKEDIRVDALSQKLPKLTQKDQTAIRNQFYKNLVYRTKNKAICVSCGHEWHNNISRDTCPKCHRKDLTPIKEGKRSVNEESYVAIYTVIEDHQVIRYFYVHRFLLGRKLLAGQREDFSIIEITQHWISVNGKRTVRAMLRNAFGYSYGQRWSFGSPMEIRTMNDCYYLYEDHVYGRRKYLPEVRRNGFKDSFHGWHPAYFISTLLREPIFETLLKAKRFEFLNLFERHYDAFKLFWPIIKMAFRRNYFLKGENSITDWFDYLWILKRINRDFLNPEIALPKNLHKEHQRVLKISRAVEKKRQEEEERIRKLEEIERRRKQEESFNKRISKFLELSLTDGEIVIEPLKTIREFEEEGEILNHCVYRNAYYGIENSLILSARIKGKRIETIEFDLARREVYQSRGYDNLPTKFNKRIIALVNSNVKTIMRLQSAHVKKAILEPELA